MVRKLQIRLLQARGLAAKDCNGLSDPYVRIHLGSVRAKSSTVYKCLNPVWNEDFVFVINSQQIQFVDITVWDADFLSSDDFLGKVSLNLDSILQSENMRIPSSWYPLQRREFKNRELVTGEIQIAFTIWSDELIRSLSNPTPHSNHVSHSTPDPTSNITSGSDSCSSDQFSKSEHHPHPSNSSKTNSVQNDKKSHNKRASHGSKELSASQGQFVLSSKEELLLEKMNTNFQDPSKPTLRNRISSVFHSHSHIKKIKTPRHTNTGSRPSEIFSDSFAIDHNSSPHPVSPPSSSFSFPSQPSSTSSDEFIKSPSVSTTSPNPSSLPPSPSSSQSSHVHRKTLSLFRSRSPSVSSDSSSNHIKEREEKGASSPSSSPFQSQEFVPISWFDEERKEQKAEKEMPPPLSGGVVLDQTFNCSPHVLNAILFKPESDFTSDLSTVRKVSQIQTGPWVFTKQNGIMKREISYMTAPSSLIKSVLAKEENWYVRADCGGFVIRFSVATPDVPYGNTFRTELQFCIYPVQDGYSHLCVSWQAKFLQSTMMKGMIENGMKKGIKATYVTFLEILSKYVVPVSVDSSSRDDTSDVKNQIQKSRNQLEFWKENSKKIFTCFSFVFSLLMIFLLPLHFFEYREPAQIKHGIETIGLDLPDSFLELFYSCLILICLNRTVQVVYKHVLLQIFKHGHHGQKAKGEGWLITISLIKGENLFSSRSNFTTDPYVMFTCNGKTRNSSVKLGSSQPVWNEILEFDAFDDPPSILTIEAFNYGGPFSGAELLGHADFSLLKIKRTDQEICIPLEGRTAKASSSKIYLRVFVTNTNEKNVPEFFQKMEKEVGKKFQIKSRQRNAAFQKLFDLPEHEFLITEFSCAVKKRIPIQGRIFISPRLLCFYSNIFGIKTKFSFMWADVDEIRENAPTINSFNRMINPSVTFYLKKNKSLDCANGSYGVDSSGRLKLRFLSFLRPNLTFRILQTMWKNHNLSLDQQLAKVTEEEAKLSKELVIQTLKDEIENEESITHEKDIKEENGHVKDIGTKGPSNSILNDTDNLKMEEVLSLEIPVSVELFLNLVDNDEVFQKVAFALDHRNLEASPWEPVDSQSGSALMLRRTLKFNLPPQLCPFNSLVCLTQQKSKDDKHTWCVLEEVISMPNIPFGDDFQVETRKELRIKKDDPNVSILKGFVGISWLNSSSVQTKISKNVIEYQKKMMRSMVDIITREVIAASQGVVNS